jgi:hypothetical protein
MVQVLPQSGSLFGRIGSGIGQGLAEQLPKEIERGRLAQGLQQFEQDSAGLNPMQSLARAYAIPGITPQMSQSFGELARQQGIKNSYTQTRGKQNLPRIDKPNASQAINDVNFGNFEKNARSKTEQKDFVRPTEQGQPQAVDTNPLRQEAIPLSPWSTDRRNEERAILGQEYPWMNVEQINEMASDNERRELAQPEAEQAKDAYKTEKKKEIEEAFTKKLEKLTQKQGPDVFKDVTGEMQNNFLRTVERDIASNPKLTVEDAVEKRVQQLFQIPKAKTKLNILASRNIFDQLNPIKKKEAMKNLLSASTIFADVGDNEEFFDILKTKNDEKIGTRGFDLSPENAAWIAYPRSKNIENFTKSINPQKLGQDSTRRAQYYASQVGKLMSDDDSILSILKEIYVKDPYFDKSVFMDYFRDNQKELGLTSKQKQEFLEKLDVIPTWGDITLFPYLFREPTK